MYQGRNHWLDNLPAFLQRGRSWYRKQTARWRQQRPAPAPVLPEHTILADLRGPAPRQRWEAAAALGANPERGPKAILALTVALTDPEPFVRWQAIEALAAQEPASVFPVLRSCLEDDHPLRRAGAAEALGRIGGGAACIELEIVLGDPAPVARAAAAQALGVCGNPEIATSLVLLLRDPDPEVRSAAAGALGRVGSPVVAGELAAALAQPNQPLLVRRAMAAALARWPEPKAQPVLLAALSDPDAQVRGYAVEALGQVGDERASQTLAAIQHDGSCLLRGTVGDQATQALSRIEHRKRQATSTSGSRV